MSERFPGDSQGWPASGGSGPEASGAKKGDTPGPEGIKPGKSKKGPRGKKSGASESNKSIAEEHRSEREAVDTKKIGKILVEHGPDTILDLTGDRKKKESAKSDESAKEHAKQSDAHDIHEDERQYTEADVHDIEPISQDPSERASKEVGEIIELHDAAENARETNREDDMSWPEHEVRLDEIGGDVIIRINGNKPLDRIEASTSVETDTDDTESAASEDEAAVDSVPAFAPGATQHTQPEVYVPNHEASLPEALPLTIYEGEEEAPPDDDPAEEAPDAAEPSPEVPMTPVTVVEASQRLEPAAAYRLYMDRETARQKATNGPGEEMVTKQAAEDAVYYATKNAQRRGVVAGAVVAGLWARRRGKKLRRQFNEQFKKQDKELQQVKRDQHFYEAEQTKRQAESDRRFTATENQLANAERQLADYQQTDKQSQPAQTPERQESDMPEQLSVPAEHRLQTSAWHTIEVDARTGKPVETPTFSYGHEYYRERAHEGSPAAQRNAAAGEVALMAAGANPRGARSDAAHGGGSVSSSDIPSATRQGPPPSDKHQSTASARDLLTRTTAAGPIWPYLLALVVIFICIALLIH